MTATAGGTRPRTGPVVPRRRRRPGWCSPARRPRWSRRCWPASGSAPSPCRPAPSSSPCSTGCPARPGRRAEPDPGGRAPRSCGCRASSSPRWSAPGWPSRARAYQGVFRNPLADPYLLGAAAGAGLGATLVIACSPTETLGPFGDRAARRLRRRAGRRRLRARPGTRPAARTAPPCCSPGSRSPPSSPPSQTLVQQQNTDDLREVYCWLLGQLGRAQWSDVVLVLPYSSRRASCCCSAGGRSTCWPSGTTRPAGAGRPPRPACGCWSSWPPRWPPPRRSRSAG